MHFPGFSYIRIVVLLSILALVVLSQCFWFLRGWRLAGRLRWPLARRFFRGLCILGGAAMVYALSFGFRFNYSATRNHLGSSVLAGLWFTSSFFAFLAVQFVALIDRLWRGGRRTVAFLRRRRTARVAAGPASAAETERTSANLAPGMNVDRRRFLKTTSVFAGALPFASTLYGFAVERLDFHVRRVDLPIAGLPEGLAGMRIAQLSDVHMSAYMSAADVRRAVDMANELRADLAVVTGDFITTASDPLEGCIAELSRLHAPLGVWGCNGNHEIWADAEQRAADLFCQYGMRLLRQESAEVAWNGQPFNLMGVDYQRQTNRWHPMLREIEPLVRRDVPNILLSHNPNTFPRAARLGIELSLAGHTHGGQVKVEILDHQITPAAFVTPYLAGMFERPLGAASFLDDNAAWSRFPQRGASLLYVNRGLGTIGAPVRLGVPPEISLLTLRRA